MRVSEQLAAGEHAGSRLSIGDRLAFDQIDCRPVVERLHFDKLPRHKIRVDDVTIAGLALELDRDAVGLVALAAPGRVLLGGGVCAGSARDMLGRQRRVAKLVSGAELALIPRWIGAEWRRHSVGQRDAATPINRLLCGFGVKLYAFGVDSVVVLTDCQVERHVYLGAKHVDLHLGPVLWLGLLYAILDQSIKRLLAVSFELGKMALFRCFWHARFDDAVDAAADVRAEVNPVLGIAGAANVDANGAQVGDNRCLLHVATAEQAKNAAWECWLHGMSKLKPQPSVAWVAELRCAKVRAGLLGVSLVMSVNHGCDRLVGFWDFHFCAFAFVELPPARLADLSCARASGDCMRLRAAILMRSNVSSEYFLPEWL